MLRRILVVAGVLVLAFPTVAYARTDAPPLKHTLKAATIDPKIAPAGLNQSAKVGVIVEVKGDPVAPSVTAAGKAIKDQLTS